MTNSYSVILKNGSFEITRGDCDNSYYQGSNDECIEWVDDWGKIYLKEGIKHDQGKLNLTLLPFDALENVAKVLEHGAKEYSPNGWRSVEYERYEKALLRHISKYFQGEMIDSKSGLPHIDHIVCNAMFLSVLKK